MNVTHIVRRYGMVGGMESYVWHLTHALANQGVSVRVICESVIDKPVGDISVELVASPVRQRPRWEAMLHFVREVNSRIQKGNLGVIHSHERCGCHHVTTFHGPPMGDLLKSGPWLKRIQKRVKVWAQLERSELFSPTVQAVIPVSTRSASSLTDIYPAVADKLTRPGWPGLIPDALKPNECRGPRILFVGREWKRKGLDIALRTFIEVKKKIPDATLDVYGHRASSLSWPTKKYSKGVIFHGWSDNVPYHQYSVLIHPARSEPFGMVIPEARAAGVIVLTSNQVGAIDLPLTDVIVLDIDARLQDWVGALCSALDGKSADPQISWTWSDLAAWHSAEVYRPLIDRSISA